MSGTPVAVDLSSLLTSPGIAAWRALDELADRVSTSAGGWLPAA